MEGAFAEAEQSYRRPTLCGMAGPYRKRSFCESGSQELLASPRIELLLMSIPVSACAYMREQKASPKPKRTGVPFTLYLSDSLAIALSDISDRRQVPKSTLVRYAVERLIAELESEQLKLPIGI